MNERGPTYETADGLDSPATEATPADTSDLLALVEERAVIGDYRGALLLATALLWRAFERLETMESQVHELSQMQGLEPHQEGE